MAILNAQLKTLVLLCYLYFTKVSFFNQVILNMIKRMWTKVENKTVQEPQGKTLILFYGFLLTLTSLHGILSVGQVFYSVLFCGN